MSSKFINFDALKKILLILFLSSYLVSTTELHELLKLPQLIEHFIEHKEAKNEITFLDFLIMHYSSSNDGDNDTDKDKRLPFKSHAHSENFSVNAFISFSTIEMKIKQILIPQKQYKSYFSDFIKSAYLSSIWQPPKLS